MPHPILGTLLHWLGGLAAGSFYVPYREIKGWAWETYWLAGGFFSWIIAPWVMALALTPEPLAVLRETPGSTLFWAYLFGSLWGVGNLTFGLTVRYLGLSLGMAVSMGYCAAFGTLVPPIFSGEFKTQLIGSNSGITILIGIAVCVGGIAVAGLAGMNKERDMPEAQKKGAIKEFNLRKGLLVATASGILSSCFAYGLKAGDPIKLIAEAHGASKNWEGLPVLIVVLLGGFTSNCFWCLLLNVRNGTGYQYFSRTLRAHLPRRQDAPSTGTTDDIEGGVQTNGRGGSVPLLGNWLFGAIGGVTWYLQFFFYTMGSSKMGAYDFSSWSMHVASIIIFGTLWGIYFKEWKGSSPRTKALLSGALGLLILSTIIIGGGHYLSGFSAH